MWYLYILQAIAIFVFAGVLGFEAEVDISGSSYPPADLTPARSEFYADRKVVLFQNKIATSAISIYWSPNVEEDEDTEDGSDVFMMELPPLGVQEITTTVGHHFTAFPSSDNSVILSPQQIRITGETTLYSFKCANCKPSVSADNSTAAAKCASSIPMVNRISNSGDDHTEKVEEILEHFTSLQNDSTAPPVTEEPVLSRPHPSVRVIGMRSTAMAAKFRCLVPKTEYYFEDGRGGSFQGVLSMGKETTTNTYEGHVFFFTEPGRKDKELARFEMNKNQVILLLVIDSIALCTDIPVLLCLDLFQLLQQ
jgi:hypothetical protein